MARRCAVTGKTVLSGNWVAHSNKKAPRKFLPNLHQTSFYSEILNEMVRLKASSQGIRTVEQKGGLDAYLLNTNDSKLPPEAKAVKRRLKQRQRKLAAKGQTQAA